MCKNAYEGILVGGSGSVRAQGTEGFQMLLMSTLSINVTATPVYY